ncbi:hypothetical protein TWF225_004835 [Orbilia oligospora]|uniref:Uncharacterized protein n=1 Tax=Orbilia oligospora TaxID=2813651 RepID=A0A7C8TSB2_ORBOL|nr:hypothetical protein TWF751_000907 [Orbilia oligospora]KAF3186320.1 hypothetical protein TWF225_004835 [Orbilia oligospora]KAF3260714.1 hypothetical protein TWF128_003346 [Orbilia oligospora]KAF3260715.1 hypothetical protein TWF128_003346 [Orbilia oligospora]KAF3272662.1 hypothetical protein TWF217_000140 [Orbilia oligospora]
MGKVVWTPENDRKLLIRLIDKSAKSYNSEALCKLFEGATPKAIEERIAKLKREAKALDSRCAVQPSAPHKPKGNYYTAPPVPGHPYGFKRNLAQTQDDEDQEGGKPAGGKGTKKAKTVKKKPQDANETGEKLDGANAKSEGDYAEDDNNDDDDDKPLSASINRGINGVRISGEAKTDGAAAA